MAEIAATGAYRFPGFRVELTKRRLSSDDGTAVVLSSRAFDVLVYLLENRARVVSKKDLLAAAWPQLVVEENNLNQAISTLRRALGERRGAPRFIATIPGRGYQFIAETSVERTAPVLRSIAVLPLRPLVPAAGQPALELGMTESLINQLSLLPSIRVAPLSSVRRYTDPDGDALQAARIIGVDAVLEGHVQTEPGRMRVTARLLDTRDGASLWAGKFDDRSADLMSLQDALASRIADALSIDLSVDTRRELLRHPTQDDAAWRLYLSGRYHWDRKTPEGLRSAIELYQAAIARDPRFASAYAGLADAYAVLGVFAIRPARATFTLARQMAERAIQLDARLAEAHTALGHIVTQLDRDWDTGERHYQVSLGLKPAYAQTWMWLALNAAYRGHLALAREHIRKAQALEPMSLSFAAIAGMIMYLARDFAGSAEHLAQLVRSVPDAPLPRHLYARVLLAQGAAAEALALVQGDTGAAPGSLSNLGRAYALCGRHIEAGGEVERLRRLGAEGFGVGYDLCQIHIALGERDAALAALEQGVDDGSQMIGYLNCDAALDPIRDEPRVAAVARRLGLG